MAPFPGEGRRRLRLGAAAAAGLLGLTGVGALAVGLSNQVAAPSAPPVAAPSDAASSGAAAPSPGSSSPDASSTGAASPSPAARGPETGSPGETGKSGPATPELDYSRPTELRIPSIGVRSSLVDLGLDRKGAMETPEPVSKAGWFTPSPPPGVPGATVIAGHVTWDQEPMVFYELGRLRKGDAVRLSREDGATVVYRVTRTATFPKTSFPTKEVYSQPQQPELRLITCGGEYDDGSNRYLSNVIVWADIARVIPG